MEDEKPPVRRLVLKARDVDPVDKPSRPGDGTAISVRLMHLGNNLAAEHPREQWPGAAAQPPVEGDPSIFKPKEVTPIDPPSYLGDEGAISVSGMLHENRAAADDSTPELIAMPPRRRSRRNRDFLILLSCALASFGTLAALFRSDMQLVGLAAFGIVFLTVILAWIMYGVMDKY
jgi:hypothetical protein